MINYILCMYVCGEVTCTSQAVHHAVQVLRQIVSFCVTFLEFSSKLTMRKSLYMNSNQPRISLFGDNLNQAIFTTWQW